MKLKATATVKMMNPDDAVKMIVDKGLEHQLHVSQAKVQGLTCPDHGAGVTVSLEGAGPTRQLRITGCCDAFRKHALDVIRQK
jgi:hypothetical protein